MGQAGSNDEKNWGSKISLDCPFKGFVDLQDFVALQVTGFVSTEFFTLHVVFVTYWVLPVP